MSRQDGNSGNRPPADRGRSRQTAAAKPAPPAPFQGATQVVRCAARRAPCEARNGMIVSASSPAEAERVAIGEFGWSRLPDGGLSCGRCAEAAAMSDGEDFGLAATRLRRDPWWDGPEYGGRAD